MKLWMMPFYVKKSLKTALSKLSQKSVSLQLLTIFLRKFDANGINKVDINELSQLRPNNETLREMQHSKWATSNSLFDYNSFINDFYHVLDEYKTYKARTEHLDLAQVCHSLKSAVFCLHCMGQRSS